MQERRPYLTLSNAYALLFQKTWKKCITLYRPILREPTIPGIYYLKMRSKDLSEIDILHYDVHFFNRIIDQNFKQDQSFWYFYRYVKIKRRIYITSIIGLGVKWWMFDMISTWMVAHPYIIMHLIKLCMSFSYNLVVINFAVICFKVHCLNVGIAPHMFLCVRPPISKRWNKNQKSIHS